MKISDLYLHSSSDAVPLRIGILLDDWALIRPFAMVVGDIRRCDFARLELLIFKQRQRPGPALPRRSFPARLWNALRDPRLRRTLGWNFYCRFDARCFPAQDDPLYLEDCRELLAGIELLQVTPINEGCGHCFPEEAIAALRAKNLDVMLHFGFGTLHEEILNSARYGVWSFHYGDNDWYRGGPAHFWEMAEGNPLSGVILQVLSDVPNAGAVLLKGLFATSAGISLIQNRVQPYWGSAHMVIQKLWELHQCGWDFVKHRMPPPAPYRGKRKMYCTPSNSELAQWLIPEMAKKAAKKIYRSIRRADEVKHWRIAIRCGSPAAPETPLDMEGFRWIESPKGHFYADPFLFEKDGRLHLFFEDLRYQENRGVIAHAEIFPGGEMGPVHTVLDTGAHASYPCVFTDGNDVYMVPETVENQGVQLFRCSRFPEAWMRMAVLFRGPAVDTTVWREDGLWWFFTTLQELRGQGMALYLFWSDTLTGVWRYHPQNPISFDVRRARGAGNIFHHDGMLIRPSQDCSGSYGRAFALNRILKLTREEYEEEVLQVVEPNRTTGLLALHTYNQSTTLQVTDGQCLRPRASVW